MAEERTNLAYERSRLAADRTLMAWMRTSLSMISFGFTIFKFFQYLKESGAFSGFASQRPRNFGSALVIAGTVLLGFAVVEYISFINRLNKEGGRRFHVSTAFVAAFLLSFMGLIALGNMLFRIGPL
jgi:putative membrane protein